MSYKSLLPYREQSGQHWRRSSGDLTKRILIFSLLLLSAVATQAEEGQGFTIYPHVGQTFYAGSTNLDDDSHLGLGIGYRFDNPWAIEFTYLEGDADSDVPGIGDIDVDMYHLGALYHLKTRNKFTPFLSIGAGEGEYSRSGFGDDDEFQINAGAGFKWAFTEQAHLRSDLRFFHGNNEDAVNAAISVGLHYAFGKASAPAPVAAAPAAEGDADGDGVLDSLDRCPNTPAGVGVNSRGCPLDDDGDGVYNYQDDCPNTTNRKARVDGRGCYIKLDRKIDITLNLEFDFDSAEARDEHTAEVRKVADVMQEYPDSRVTMAGHTDSTGPAEYNPGLSERRAKTIADMLTDKFDIDASRVSHAGYGESQPVDTNDTREGRQNNRRVVAHVEGETEELEMK